MNIEGPDGKNSVPVTFLDQPKIRTTLPRIQDELSARGITVLSDVGRKALPIRVLLGADVIGSILTGRVEIFKSGISAVENAVGWTIMGLGKKKEVFNLVSFALKNFQSYNFWDLEVLGIADPTKQHDKMALEEDTLIHFQETLKVNNEKHYEVTLFWFVGHPPLNNNREVAVFRLRSVTKLLEQKGTFNAYKEVFLNWKKEEIIEKAESSEGKISIFYLPHTDN